MDFKAGTTVALKVVIRGRGIYIALLIALSLTYYAVFIKHPHTSVLLIVACILTSLTAIITDSTIHNSIFYAFRISGAVPSIVMTYIITIVLIVSFVSLIPQIMTGDLFKIILTYFKEIILAILLLNIMHNKVKESLTMIPL